MGCCRGRQQQVVASHNGSAPCKQVEQGGAGLKLLVATDRGLPMLLMRAPSSGDRYDITTYLSMHKCGGPTARSILLHAERILQAMRTNIAPFRKFANGASLVTLLKTADAVLKDTRSSQNAKRGPVPDRF